MLRAHRQAWAWQDEWTGLTMEDIREIERQTQLALQKKMGLAESNEDAIDDEEALGSNNAVSTPQDSDMAKTLAATLGSIEKNEDPQSPLTIRKPSDIPIINTAISSEGEASPEDSPTETSALRYFKFCIYNFKAI